MTFRLVSCTWMRLKLALYNSNEDRHSQALLWSMENVTVTVHAEMRLLEVNALNTRKQTH